MIAENRQNLCHTFSSCSGNFRNQNKTQRTRQRFERARNSVWKINKWTINVIFSDFSQKSDFFGRFKVRRNSILPH